MKATGVTPESAKGANMPLIFGLTYLFSFMLAMAMNFLVIHQFHVMSIMMHEPGFGTDPNSEASIYFSNFMAHHGTSFRSFGHGAVHGFLSSLFIVLPVVAINALFEMKSFKYIAINVGFFVVSMILMGGIICQFG
jgi:hypothetical protein